MRIFRSLKPVIAAVNGAAVGVGKDTEERVLLLKKAGVDLVVVDTAHGHSSRVLDTIMAIKKISNRTQVIGGNVATNAGGLHVLVNCAGILKPARTHEMPLDEWNRVITVNLTGTFLVTQALLPPLLESGRGVVINLSSTSAFQSSVLGTNPSPIDFAFFSRIQYLTSWPSFTTCQAMSVMRASEETKRKFVAATGPQSIWMVRSGKWAV